MVECPNILVYPTPSGMKIVVDGVIYDKRMTAKEMIYLSRRILEEVGDSFPTVSPTTHSDNKGEFGT